MSKNTKENHIPPPPPLPPTNFSMRARQAHVRDDWNVGTKPAEKEAPILRRSMSETSIPRTPTQDFLRENATQFEDMAAPTPPLTPSPPVEPKTYRTELVIAIAPRAPEPVPVATVPVPVVPGPADIQAAMGACVEIHTAPCGATCTAHPEELPHVNILNLVKYFESEIQKETEGADQNRKEYDDLMKYKKVPRWSTSRAPGATCNVPIQRRLSSLTPKPLQIKLKSSSEKTAEKTTSISKSFGTLAFKGNALSKTTVSEEEHEASEEKLVHSVSDRADFQNQLSLADRKLVVVDFYATWCGPCMKIAPKVDLLAIQHRDRVTFLKVDIEGCGTKELVKEFQITALPTFIFIKHSKKIDGFSGAGSAEEKLKALIAKYS